MFQPQDQATKRRKMQMGNFGDSGDEVHVIVPVREDEQRVLGHMSRNVGEIAHPLSAQTSTQNQRKRDKKLLDKKLQAPLSFYCPLNKDIMFDPVIDNNGNSYERHAFVAMMTGKKQGVVGEAACLQGQKFPNLLSNNTLREAIYEFMGDDWVEKKMLQSREQADDPLMYAAFNQSVNPLTILPKASPDTAPLSERGQASISNESFKGGLFMQSSSGGNSLTQANESSGTHGGIQPAASPYSSRDRVNQYLWGVSRLSNVDLRLNESGLLIFQARELWVVLDVPENQDIFCVHTTTNFLDKTFFAHHRLSVCERALQLNFLQVETRGGCLSFRRCADSSLDLLFSYSDRVELVTAAEFTNVLQNFVDTALRLREDIINYATGITTYR